MLKVCVFDLDGTLADTVESMAYVTNIIMKQYGLKELPTENFKYYCGEGARMLITRALKDAGDPELTRLDECEHIYKEMFAENPLYKVVPYEGIMEILHEFKKRGIKLAVCSNKPNEATIKVIDIMFPGIFDAVIGQSEKIRRKPAPDGPLKIAEDFGVKTEECMYIGDTATDMKTGKAAGMYTVGALWGFRDLEELESNGADIIAEKPVDLIQIFEDKNND